MQGTDSVKLNYDKIASQYARHRGTHPEVIKQLIMAGGAAPEHKVLEVGCGTGNYILEFRASTCCSCWGIDPSLQMLAEARKRSSAVRFALGCAECLPFSGGFFDLVYSVDVIHHLEARTDFLREAFRVIKPGGTLCTVTESEWMLRSRVPLAAYFPQTVERELGRYPSTAALVAMTEEVGFHNIAETEVEHAYEIDDLRAFEEKAFSVLHTISEDAFGRGIALMKKALAAGPIQAVSRYLLLWGTK